VLASSSGLFRLGFFGWDKSGICTAEQQALAFELEELTHAASTIAILQRDFDAH
jgi:hypothetical protein